jgi:plastocyanin
MHVVNRDLGIKTGLALAAALALTATAFLAFLLTGERADAAGGASASGSKTVTMPHVKFTPGTLHVSKGTRVVFSNNSRLLHNATSKSFKTGNIKPGNAVAVKFTAKGTYRYHCTLHPDMHGKIVVG